MFKKSAAKAKNKSGTAKAPAVVKKVPGTLAKKLAPASKKSAIKPVSKISVKSKPKSASGKKPVIVAPPKVEKKNVKSVTAKKVVPAKNKAKPARPPVSPIKVISKAILRAASNAKKGVKPVAPQKAMPIIKTVSRVPVKPVAPVQRPVPAARPTEKPISASIKPPAIKSTVVKPIRTKSIPNDISLAAGLTDEDVRAMPETDYMNDLQMEFFRLRLIKMREEVLARELDVKERLHQREVFADPADRATAEEEHWLDLRLRERESMLMRKIEDSLRRIRDKEYGYCTKTGEAIGIPRLLARPTATVIVDVKGQDEKVETHFRDR